MLTQVVREICSYVPELVDHLAVLEAIEERLVSKGFTLVCRSDGIGVSSTLWGTTPDSRLVYLAVKNGVGGLSVLFDLLHEAGHVASGEEQIHHRINDTLIRADQRRREVDAWRHAEQTLVEFGLKQLLPQFEERRATCLGTYGL
jgi:hypothetical protein